MLSGMSEYLGATLIFAGLAAVVAGLIWGGLCLLAVILRRRRVRRLLLPAGLVAAGLVIGALPVAYQHLYLAIVGFGERERVVDGERMITLTGWDRHDYALLAGKRDVVVLDMGNPDVTDDTLEVLEGCDRLRELTLSDTRISDAGLELLAKLPALESLRIARTGVTADGVRRLLEAAPRLERLDVTGVEMPTSILRDWKNAAGVGMADRERRYVH
jgi:hypothetical protein